MGEGHITCGEFAARLSDYLENEVAGTKRAQMESHAQTCAACANSLEGVRNLTRRLARMSRERPSAGFDFALRSRLMMEAAQKPSFWNRLPDVFFPTIPRALASAAAVVLMALGMTTALDEAPETRGANADRVHQMTLVAPCVCPISSRRQAWSIKDVATENLVTDFTTGTSGRTGGFRKGRVHGS